MNTSGRAEFVEAAEDHGGSSTSQTMVLSPSKKRKRDADADDKLSFKLSNQPASQLGPVLGE